MSYTPKGGNLTAAMADSPTGNELIARFGNRL